METHGQHLLLDIWLKETLTSQKLIPLKALINRKFQVVGEAQHQFHPYGLTLVYILSESHFTIHTYPEHQFLSLDLYICNMGIDLNQVLQDILSLFKVQSFRHHLLLRGFAINPPLEKRPHPSLSNGKQ